MSDEMQFEPLGALDEQSGLSASGDADLRRLSDVPVELTVEIGRTRMTVGDTLQLRPGSIVSLNRTAGEPADLLVNGTRIARGEVVVVDEEFGLRITEVVGDAVDEDTAVSAVTMMAAAAPPELVQAAPPELAPAPDEQAPAELKPPPPPDAVAA